MIRRKEVAPTGEPVFPRQNRQPLPAGGQGNQATDSNLQDPTLQRALRQVANGNYEKAFDLLLAAGKSPQLLNARGVCLLRMGKFDQAIRAFRELLLNPGSTWVRPELPVLYKTNYATALLVGGHPSGCLDILDEIKEEANPTVKSLRAAIKKWESGLSLWQRLNWRVGRIEPTVCRVETEFPLGAFDETASVDPRHPEDPQHISGDAA